MKKIVSSLLAALLVAPIVAACGGTGGTTAAPGGDTTTKPDSGKQVTLTVSVFAQEHEQAMYKEVIQKFETERNVKVDFQVAGDQYWPELEAALTANTEPDVFYLGLGDIKKRVWADKVVP